MFLHRESRKVRNDGTVRWGGGFLEVHGEYVGDTVDLRYAPLQPERPVMVYVDGKYVCDAHPAAAAPCRAPSPPRSARSRGRST